ncbi:MULTISPECIES: DUF262 domain-containing protein [Rhizobium]|uniref:DUF262 domain-containing protein n=1 Tax=Rhizobium TaxID=379 RepID=UPI0018D595CE|nr:MULTISPECIES: DUF262 domain-containing protein [Rhizobium]
MTEEILSNLSEFAPLDQQEDLDDVSGHWISDAVLWSTDWTTETIISQLRRGNIDLNPRFQRRSAWTDKRKSLFIESLIYGVPIPQIILAEDKKKKGRFVVIDGKQRLLAIRQFAAEPKDDFDMLVLKGLEPSNGKKSIFEGKTYTDMRSDIDLKQYVDSFDNQTIRTVVIRNWKDEEYLYSVFLRINQNSVSLSPQELRQAIDPGEFSEFVDENSGTSDPLRAALGLKTPDFRMRDAELLLRYYAYRNFAHDYRGNLKKFLDSTHNYFNRHWSNEKTKVVRQLDEFNQALITVRDIFGERDYLRKWNGTTFEPRINRAVFDIMMFYFSDPDVAAKGIANREKVVEAFVNLCQLGDFLSSLESTTKSLDANRTRFSMWADALNRELGTDLKSPLR